MSAAVRFAVVNAANGNNSIVAAVTGKHIRVLHYALVAAVGATCRFDSASAGTALTGNMVFGTTGGINASFEKGLFETLLSQALFLSSTADVDGHLTYVLL